MNARKKTPFLNFILLLFLLAGVLVTACKDPYLAPLSPQDPSPVRIGKPLVNAKPALALGAEADRRSTGPIKCVPFPYMVCIGLFPVLEIPEVFVIDFPDLPIGPDPCPDGLSCPGSIPFITKLVDANGKPIAVDVMEVDPMMVVDDFLFIQFNQPESETLISENSYTLKEPVELDPEWTAHLGLEGNLIDEGTYYTQYNAKLNSTVMAVPLDKIGYQKR